MTGTGSTLILLNAVILAVTAEVPRFLLRPHVDLAPPDTGPALPYGPFEPAHHRTLEIALRGWVTEQTGMPIGYVEQLYTFGDRYRDPRELAGGPRVISVGYLALVREAPAPGDAEWLDCYDFLPWEDWRGGRPAIIDRTIIPALELWADAADGRTERSVRRERLSITFGAKDAAWDSGHVLERYEVLYEAGLVMEAARDRSDRGDSPGNSGRDDEHYDSKPCRGARELTGRMAALDHRRMMATALGRIRGKLQYRPVVFELLPTEFTLLRLQRVAESLAGVNLHKQNFRRLVVNNRLVEATENISRHGPGRPAKLFRFRRDVLRERATPGVG
ncbi:MAG: hypothetical protein VCC99_06345, partial [Alphaproteobacteria bacterium]